MKRKRRIIKNRTKRYNYKTIHSLQTRIKKGEGMRQNREGSVYSK